MNRGSGFKGHMILQGEIASMRPRFMNRGSLCDPHGRHTGRGRFNEAPIHESGKS